MTQKIEKYWMNNYDILIIGAGASGLLAGRELARAGKKICILEARNRIGGRIHTEQAEGFSVPIENGAEFIHGRLPHTFRLIEESGIAVYPVGGRFYSQKNGAIDSESNFMDHADELEEKLNEVKEDISLKQFMDIYLSEKKYDGLRNSLRGFAEGFDAGDTNLMSTIAFREEWLNESWEQYRIEGGYQKLMQYLADENQKRGAEIFLSRVVKNVNWKKDFVEVITADGKKYSSKKILITVPLGILALNETEEASITFDPPLDKKMAAIRKMGYGPVIKIILEFKTRFWENKTPDSIAKNRGEQIGFIFSQEKMPTWWTQFPREAPILTGWLAGPNAKRFATLSDKEILEQALQSISGIFAVDLNILKQELRSSKIANWITDPFSQGAYAFAALEMPSAKRELLSPEENTIYFAGEALSEDSVIGTVEAAFASGVEAARKIISGANSFSRADS